MDPIASITLYTNVGKSAAETLSMNRQLFGEESMSRTQNVQTHRDRKKARQVKSKVKNMTNIFCDFKRIVYKEVVLAGQTVNFGYYCDVRRRPREKCVKTSPRTLATRELVVAPRQRTVSYFLLHQGFCFTKINMTVAPIKPTFLYFPD
jgi:hypothetical protein